MSIVLSHIGKIERSGVRICRLRMLPLLLFTLLLQAVDAYLPEFKISNFDIGDQVALKANQVTSTKTQIPFDYYDLPFCKRKRSRGKSVNLGERLSGDKETTSPYIVSIHFFGNRLS